MISLLSNQSQSSLEIRDSVTYHVQHRCRLQDYQSRHQESSFDISKGRCLTVKSKVYSKLAKASD